MEADSGGVEDDDFYASDFEEELDHVLGVEEFFGGVFQHEDVLPSSNVHDDLFYPSDFESDVEDKGDVQELLEGVLAEEGLSSTGVESPLPFFDNVPIQCNLRQIQLNYASKELLIASIESTLIPSFTQIREVYPTFRPFPTHHGRIVHVDDVFHNVKRWTRLQEGVKLIDVDGEVGLTPKGDPNGRLVPCVEEWSSLVQTHHIDKYGKHLALRPTIDSIRRTWSTDVIFGGISKAYIEVCIKSCTTCQPKQVWDEVHSINPELLSHTLDQICEKYIVSRRVFVVKTTRFHKITFFRCHRGGKRRSNKKNTDKISLGSECRRERKSMKRGCQFLLKTKEPLDVDSSGIHAVSKEDVTISVRVEHTGHHPGSDGDILFLPVHPLVISLAMDNLKRMVSTTTVALASVREEAKIKAMVDGVERVTYRFYLIPKEVEQLHYGMKLNGKNSNIS